MRPRNRRGSKQTAGRGVRAALDRLGAEHRAGLVEAADRAAAERRRRGFDAAGRRGPVLPFDPDAAADGRRRR